MEVIGDLWTNATINVEADNRTRQFTSAKLSVAGVWPFLAVASSEADLGNRLALIEDRLVEAVPDSGLRQQVTGSLVEDWTIVHEARVREAVTAETQRRAAAKTAAKTATAQCNQCGKPMNPVDAMVGGAGDGKKPICQACAKKNQKDVTGTKIAGEVPPEFKEQQEKVTDPDKKSPPGFDDSDEDEDSGKPWEKKSGSRHPFDSESKEGGETKTAAFIRRVTAGLVKEAGLDQAFEDWIRGKAYRQGDHYRVRSDGSLKGGIAPWNKAVKAQYPGDTSDFHNDAKEWAISRGWSSRDTQFGPKWFDESGQVVGSLNKTAEFPWKKKDDKKDPAKDKAPDNPAAPAPADPASPAVPGAPVDPAAAPEDLAAAQPGQQVNLTYTLADGTTGQTPATVDVNDGTTVSLSYDRGTFKLTNSGGKWVDPLGTEFTMDAAPAPAVPQQQVPPPANIAVSMRKGAPFAGYENFDACVAANGDKKDPEAYCGKIKNQVEGSVHQANPYSSNGNPYTTEEPAGPASPTPSPEGQGGVAGPMTTKPRQLPGGGAPEPMMDQPGAVPPNPGQPLPQPQPQPQPLAALNGRLPVACEGCGSQALVSVGSLLDGITCRCGSTEFDLDDTIHTEAASESMSLQCMECEKKFKRKVGPGSEPKCPGCGGYDVEPDYQRGFPASLHTADMFDSGGGFINGLKALINQLRVSGGGDIPSWFPKSMLLPEEIASGKWMKGGSSIGDPRYVFGDKTADWSQNNSGPIRDVPVVEHNMRCSFCFTNFTVKAVDPAQPPPTCPSCGSPVVTAAGATKPPRLTQPVIASKVDQIASGILSTNPGMTREAALRLASETVRRYPKVALGWENEPSVCSICGKALTPGTTWVAEGEGAVSKACSPEHAAQAVSMVEVVENGLSEVKVVGPQDLAAAARRSAKKVVSAR